MIITNPISKAVARLRLSPFQRYHQNIERPFTLFSHLITLFLATLLIFTHTADISFLKRRSAVVFSNLLYPVKRTFGTLQDDRVNALSADIDLVPNENLGTTSYYIISSERLVRDTNELVQRFFTLDKEYVGCANNVCKLTMSGRVEVTLYKNSSAFDVNNKDFRYLPLEKEYKQYTLSRSDYGLPKEMELGSHWNGKQGNLTIDADMLSYIDRLVVLDINLAITTDDFSVPFWSDVMRSAYTLQVQYSLSLATGQVMVTMEPHLHVFPLSLCFPKSPSSNGDDTDISNNISNNGTASGTKFRGLYMSGKVIIIIGCVISSMIYQIFLIRNFCDFMQLWNSLTKIRTEILIENRQKENNIGDNSTTATALPTKTCMSETILFFRIFNLSLLCGTVGNVCLIFYSFLYLIYEASNINTCDTLQYSNNVIGEDFSNIFMGCSVMLLWFDTLQYFTYGEEGGNLRTLQHSAFKVGRVMVFVMPIFIGYVLFGVSTFGSQVPQFETISSAGIVLFATLNGDECRQTYTAIMEDCTDCASPIVGWIYMSSWLCFAMYVVLNIVIAIIEDVYMELKELPEEMQRESATKDPTGDFDVAYLMVIEEIEKNGYIESNRRSRRSITRML